MTRDTPARAMAQSLRSAWQQRPLRERRLLHSAALLFAVVALWQWGIAPAWSVWRAAPARQAEFDAQTRQMLQLQAEAARLKAPARLDRASAVSQLQTSAEALLGPGVQLQAQGEQLQVTLKAAPAEGLAQWLALARDKAQALPQQVQLQRQTAIGGSAPVWQGSLVMSLP